MIYFSSKLWLIWFSFFVSSIYICTKIEQITINQLFLVILHLLHSTVMDCYSNCEDQTNDLFVTTSNYPNRKTFKVDEDDDE